jgi:3-deoxy-D-arabino-heptulosonate 7-phosphate (DAHP) synthase class II
VTPVSSLTGASTMDDKERATMREHIIWLGTELERQRKLNQQHIVFLKRLLDPEDLGYAASNEVRKIAYVLLINNNTNEHQE